MKNCKFAKDSVRYLGHIILNKGIQIDTSKIQGIQDYQTPKNVKDVRRFIGMIGYYRKFIKNFSEISSPLTDLTKKYTKFIWTELEDSAFKKRYS